MTTFDELFLARSNSLLRSTANLRKLRDIYDELVRVLGANLQHVWCDEQLNFSFTGKREDLARVLRFVRKRGFALKRTGMQQKNEYCAVGTRQDGAAICLIFASTQCRVVQIGTETVERPIYQTICE